jgi:hypothetical protein
MTEQTPPQLYLDLLKRCLVNWIYMDAETRPVLPRKLAYLLEIVSGGLRITMPKVVDQEKRRFGQDWPVFGHSMVGLNRLGHIQYCIEEVLRDDIPGDLLETGVWRGGSCIFMRGVLKAFGVEDRKVWVCDSFRGLPIPNLRKYPADRNSLFVLARSLAVSFDQVKANFEKYGLLDDQVVFVKGWFRDSLPSLPVQRLSLLRLDGDMYESTMDALTNLYPRLSEGGFLIIDDYDIPACRNAIEDYRNAFGINEEVIQREGGIFFWKKQRQAEAIL